MFGLKKILSRGNSAVSDLPADLQQALTAWRATAAPSLAEAHYHTRYIVGFSKTGSGGGAPGG